MTVGTTVGYEPGGEPGPIRADAASTAVWQERGLDGMAKPAGARIRFRSIGGLIDRLDPPHDRTMAAVAEAVDLARDYRHDYRLSKVGRLDSTVGATFAYEAPNGAAARSHDLSADLLGHLGYPEAATDPAAVMTDVFTVRLGSDTVWGNAETGCFVLLAHPRTVYR